MLAFAFNCYSKWVLKATLELVRGLTRESLFASVELWVSESHNPDKITCEITYNLINTIYSYIIYRYTIYTVVTTEDKIISESYKDIYLASIDSFSVNFFSFRSHSIFLTLLHLFSS